MKNIRKNLKFIFPVFIAIMILGLVLSRVYNPDRPAPKQEVSISAEEAKEHIGTVAEVCGTVASTDYLPQVGGKPTFINFGRPHPSQVFTAVIWSTDRYKWDIPPDRHYLNREICVTGRIKLHENTPQIVVEVPGQIALEEKVGT